MSEIILNISNIFKRSRFILIFGCFIEDDGTKKKQLVFISCLSQGETDTIIWRVSLLEAKEASKLYCFFIQLLLQNLKQRLFCDKLYIVIIIYMMTVYIFIHVKFMVVRTVSLIS